MSKETIQVIEVEVKLDKNENKYVRVRTDKGWMSCFKGKHIDTIKGSTGKALSVETTTAGKFTNIENVYGEADPDEETADIQVEQIQSKQVTSERSQQVDRAKALELAQGTCMHDGITDSKVLFQVAQEYYKYITEGE